MSDRANKGMALAAGAEFERCVRAEIVEPDDPDLIAYHSVVEASATAADQTPSLAVGGSEPNASEQLNSGHAAFEKVARHFKARRGCGCRAATHRRLEGAKLAAVAVAETPLNPNKARAVAAAV